MTPTSEAVPGKVLYAQPDAPSIHVQPYTGQTYPDRIPDTYDIASRAALGVNVLVGADQPPGRLRAVLEGHVRLPPGRHEP